MAEREPRRGAERALDARRFTVAVRLAGALLVLAVVLAGCGRPAQRAAADPQREQAVTRASAVRTTFNAYLSALVDRDPAALASVTGTTTDMDAARKQAFGRYAKLDATSPMIHAVRITDDQWMASADLSIEGRTETFTVAAEGAIEPSGSVVILTWAPQPSDP